METVNVRKTNNYTHFIGRPSKLGNPFIIGVHGDREQVLEKYRVWAENRQEVLDEIRKLPYNAVLGCFCKPKSCHGDVIESIWHELHRITDFYQKSERENPMPINVSISKEDMLRSRIVQPGVYVLNIKSVTQQVGKSDPDTMTTVVHFAIESGPDPKAVGVPLEYYIGEKNVGMQIPFLEIAFGKKIPEDGVANLDLELLVGRKIKAYIKSDKFQGRDKNKIDGFLPLTT